MLILRNLTLSFIDRILFDHINVSLAYDEKIGVLGRNGAGKSTLLKVIAREQQTDSGSISYVKHKKIGYLPQEVVLNSNESVFDEAYSAFAEFVELEQEKEALEEQLSAGVDDEMAQRLTECYTTILHQLEQFDARAAHKDTKQILNGLGFSDDRFSQSVDKLSVGWKMRVVLAKLLLQKADLYLFDEPTNHLDLPTKEWFLSFLQQADFGYLLVTHDKYFLEHACDKMLELERGKAIMFSGNFNAYCVQKDEIRERQLSAYKQQQKDIARKKETISRFRASATKAAMVQSMIKELAAMELIEIEPSLSTVQFSFDSVERAGKIVLDIQKVSYAFNDHQLFRNASATVMRGRKVALIAPNGVGKTTLFNLIVGKLPLQNGLIEFGHNVSTAYFEQEQARVLNKNKTVLDEVTDACSNVSESKIRKFLGSFLFSGNEVKKKIKQLSGGEKNRVAMVKVLLQDANFLLLDEPTNHLDIYAKEVLLQALKQYQGTILFVSHDHEFVQELADTILELTPNGLYSYDGDYESYLYHKKTLEEEKNDSKGNQSKNTENGKQQKNSNKDSQLKRQLHILETKIKKLEKKQIELGEKFSDYTFGTAEADLVLEELSKIDVDLKKAYSEWEEITE